MIIGLMYLTGNTKCSQFIESVEEASVGDASATVEGLFPLNRAQGVRTRGVVHLVKGEEKRRKGVCKRQKEIIVKQKKMKQIRISYRDR